MFLAELFQFQTSPYLKDTDSDGLDDATEIKLGKNPLCPEGESCEMNESEAIIATTTLEIILPQINTDRLGAESNVGLQELADLQKVLNDPQQIRQLFLSTGKISADDLSKISDAELMKMVDEIVAEQGGVPL